MANSNRVLGKTLIIGVILLLLCMSITPSVATDNTIKPISSGNTLYVGGSGPDNYTTIVEAVGASQDGDTIFVYDDSSPYNENIGIYKSIKLIGENKNTTIIDGQGKAATIHLYGGNAIISGFTIQGGTGHNRFAGIRIFSENNIILNNIIRNNEHGIMAYYEQSNINDNLIFRNLIINNKGYGIWTYDASAWTIIDNNISFNGGHEIILSLGGNHNISNNIVISNKLNCLRVDGTNITISNNIIQSYDGEGIILWAADEVKVIGNKISNCKSYGIFMQNSYRDVIKDNTLENASRFYLWECYNNEFVNNSIDGKPLIYLESVSDKIIEEEAGLIILIGCDNVTVKNQNMIDTYIPFYLINSNKCTIIDNDFSSNNYGIYLVQSRNINIENNSFNSNGRTIFLWKSNKCFIRNNSITNSGYGIYFNSSNGCIIANNDISLSASRGIHLYSSENNIITKNILTNNIIGLYLWQNSDSNHISNNSFLNDGVYCWKSFKNTLDNNLINGKPLVYLEDKENIIISDAGQVILVNCNLIRVENLDVSNVYVGIELWKTNNCSIENINCENNFVNIKIAYSYDNIIQKNNIVNSLSYGLELILCYSHVIKKNNFIDNDEDVYFCLDFESFFENLLLGRNRWKRNYWDRPRILPKSIPGDILFSPFPLPWVQFDLRPASEPYDIEV